MSNASQRTGKASVASPTPASNDYTRRRFLLALGAGSASAAAAAASPALAAQDAAPKGVSSKTGAGYQDTDHVRNYYDSARI